VPGLSKPKNVVLNSKKAKVEVKDTKQKHGKVKVIFTLKPKILEKTLRSLFAGNSAAA